MSIRPVNTLPSWGGRTAATAVTLRTWKGRTSILRIRYNIRQHRAKLNPCSDTDQVSGEGQELGAFCPSCINAPSCSQPGWKWGEIPCNFSLRQELYALWCARGQNQPLFYFFSSQHFSLRLNQCHNIFSELQCSSGQLFQQTKYKLLERTLVPRCPCTDLPFFILIVLLFRWVNLTKEERQEAQVAVPSLDNPSCLKAREDLQGHLSILKPWFVISVKSFWYQSVAQEEDKALKKIYKKVEFEVDVNFHLVSSIMSFIPVSKLILSFLLQIFANR